MSNQSTIPAIFHDKSTGFAVQFGGQANDYMDELTTLVDSHSSVRMFVEDAQSALFDEAKPFGITIRPFLWTQGLDFRPSKDVLASAPISYPLIFLTQVANYLAFLEVTGLTHEGMLSKILVGSGHSQGVVAAALLSAATTQDELHSLGLELVRYMFLHGVRAQATFDAVPNVPQGSSPMLLVRGLTKHDVHAAVASVNSKLHAPTTLQISLINEPTTIAVTGHPDALTVLKTAIAKQSAESIDDQRAIPFSKRKPVVSTIRLNVSCPFHNAILAPAQPLIEADLTRLGLAILGHALQFPVLGTNQDAVNLQAYGETDILPDVVRMQLCDVVDWPTTVYSMATRAGVTHIFDFGPGSEGALLTQKRVEGLGVVTVAPTAAHKATELIPGLDFILSSSSIHLARSWESMYGPILTTNAVGRTGLMNKYTSRFGRQPIWVGGLNPTTATRRGSPLVAAALESGFVCELACDECLLTDTSFEAAVSSVVDRVLPGRGIFLKLVDAKSTAWPIQFSTTMKLRRQGIPIEGVTLATVDSVPRDTLNQIVREFVSANVKVVGLPASSLESIRAVVDVAKEHPTATIVLQWICHVHHTSPKDFHAPLLATYAAIRRTPNLVLVVGSPFGSADQSATYLNGDWSLAYGHAKMPCDGLLVASCLVAAKEAATADAVKSLLVATPGMDVHSFWASSRPHDAMTGFITVRDENDQPAFCVENRGSLCWRDFDRKYFSRPTKDQEAIILSTKDDIIARVNADFQKPYFGCNAAGNVVDMEQMTYLEVMCRLVELMYDTPSKRWIDATYITRVFSFMQRSEQRFWTHVTTTSKLVVQNASQLKNDPLALIAKFKLRFPALASTMLSVDDVDYLLYLCKFGGKPVNFIPIVDKELVSWFKADPSWYSEDLEAVPNQECGRVMLFQDPCAVSNVKSKNKRVGEILTEINQGIVEWMESKALSRQDPVSSHHKMDGWTRCTVSNNTILTKDIYEDDIPMQEWLSELSTVLTPNNWLFDLLFLDHYVSNDQWVANDTWKVVTPRAGQVFEVEWTASGTPTALRIHHKSVLAIAPVVEITMEDHRISIRLNVQRPATRDWQSDVVSLDRVFEYKPYFDASTIHVDVHTTEENTKAFYAQHWIAPTLAGCAEALQRSVHSTHADSFTVTAEDIATYNASLGLPNRMTLAPVDFCAVAGWKPMIGFVFSKEISGDLLHLVHLTNSFTVLAPNDVAFAAGDTIVTTGFVSALRNTPSGKLLQIQSVATRGGVDLVWMQNELLIRGQFVNHEHTFEHKSTSHVVDFADDMAVETLLAKPWFTLGENQSVHVGEDYKFELKSKYTFADGCSDTNSIDVQGSLFGGPNLDVLVGSIAMQEFASSRDPVESFVKRLGRTETGPKTNFKLLEKPLELHVPNALAYAHASRDVNPIHISQYAIACANLPHDKPITHGLWTSTKIRCLMTDVLEEKMPGTKLVSFAGEFKGIVSEGDLLGVQITHTGIQDGEIGLQVEASNAQGAIVYGAKVRVAMPRTALVFTGQGSQQLGMGMDLYATSAVVKSVWDEGDLHFKTKFGFSILDIVRNNPQSLTIRFGGKKGMAVRRNYMALTCKMSYPTAPENICTIPLFPDIKATTTSFTFHEPQGLLFATHFGPCAIVLYEKAMYMEAKSRGAVPNDCYFAGHSLGDFSALCSVTEMLTASDMAELVFLRGVIMQHAIERDANGVSDYGMMAANPERIGSKHFDENTLFNIVDMIDKLSNKLCQVVNYNVQGSQYVVAGELVNLEVLTRVMNSIKEHPTSPENLEGLIQREIAAVRMQKVAVASSKGGKFELKRGVATIPLAGLDLPFHSRQLIGSIQAFRDLLRPFFKRERLFQSRRVLEGRYMPNLMAKPFQFTKVFAQEVFDLTGSLPLKELLARWDSTPDDERLSVLCIELWAYQSASPVHWINTQAFCFNDSIHRWVEIGPTAILTGMAKKTLQNDRYSHANIEMLCVGKDFDTICYQHMVNHGELSDIDVDKAMVAPAPTIPFDAPPLTQMVVQSLPLQVILDQPVSANHVLRVYLASRFKKTLSEMDDNVTIHTLTAGKSATQNEVVGALEKEFGTHLENVGEMPISVLAATFNAYHKLGDVFRTLVNDFVRKHMPGGFNISQVKSYLATEYGLGAGRTDSVLVHSLLFPPSSRHASDAVAKLWIDTVVTDYSKFVGIGISKGTTAQHGHGLPTMAVASAPPLATVPDVIITPSYALKAFFALKFKKQFTEINTDMTIYELSAGKSAVQNEVVGELEAEFGSGVDGIADTKLGDLIPKFTSYNKPGKYFVAAVSKMLAEKLPGGFSASQMRAYVAHERCLGPNRVEIALIHALLNAPKGRFAAESEAKTWMNSVVDEYGTISGIAIPFASKVSGGSALDLPRAGTVSSAALDNLKADIHTMLKDQVTAFQSFMKVDPLDALKATTASELAHQELEKQVDLWVSEHGEYYEKGIQPKFDVHKIRIYDSSWNWAKQEVLIFYYRSMTAEVTEAELHNISNQATPELLVMIEGLLNLHESSSSNATVQFMERLKELTQASLVSGPRHKQQHFRPVRPDVSIEENGTIVYKEVPRGDSPLDYVNEIAHGINYNDVDGAISSKEGTPYVRILKHDTTNLVLDDALTKEFLLAMREIAVDGVSFVGMNALVTGCGRDSIASEVVKALLEGGATVVCTTSSFSFESTKFFRSVYEKHGAHGSKMILVPFNQASSVDCTSLVAHIYEQLKIDLDFVIPFGA
ncbi:hypothetical protein As57867_001060, partial [Aphanomyces stellatus]